MQGRSDSEVPPKLLQKTFKALLLFAALCFLVTTVTTPFEKGSLVEGVALVTAWF